MAYTFEREDNMKEIQTGFQEQTRRYSENFQKYGHSEMSMFMPSDRRVIRYYELLKNFEFFLKGDFTAPVTICDAGCGFGDVNQYLVSLGMKNYRYIGLDVVEEFMKAGRERYQGTHISYLRRNFMTDDMTDLEYDYAISSQTFTIPYTEEDHNYETVYTSVRKLFARCRKGVSFNFFTDRVDFKRSGTAYHSPVRLLEFAYSLSNNVVLDNSCFPYECTLTILKDNACEKNGMVYDRFMRIHEKEFSDGTFVVNLK